VTSEPLMSNRHQLASLFIQPFGSKFQKPGEFQERDVPVLTPAGASR
jgi:hypothetical protein